MIDSTRGKVQQLLEDAEGCLCGSIWRGGTEGAVGRALASQSRDLSGMSGRKLEKLSC